MPTRTLEIDLRQGTGAESEPMYGIVTVQRAKAKTTGGFEILPFETSLKLIDGKATITEAETDGTGPLYDSAYLFRVQNGYCAPRWGFMAALPDGTTPITTGELPMVDPITGEGIYMDAQEWNELYGDLPDRVSSLEGSQATQNTQIASLQTGKANTAHTHVIGDVTGLQTALNAKGNATVRVDTTVGTRVFITDGTTEEMISGDTGERNVSHLLSNGWAFGTSGAMFLQRIGNTVNLRVRNIDPSTAISDIFLTDLPVGFRPRSGNNRMPVVAGASTTTSNSWAMARSWERDVRIPRTAGTIGTQYDYIEISWATPDEWPTSLPGTPA